MLLLASLCACGGPDTRTRVNETHITIRDRAEQNHPIIGWAVENGTPSKHTFKVTFWFLELSVLGEAIHPSACAIVIEEAASQTPIKDPSTDDSILSDPDAKPRTERSYTVPCSERKRSTRIVWPGNSIVLLGHVSRPITEHESFDSEQEYEEVGDWQFGIDEIPQAPRIAEFDPPGSFTFSTPQVSPSQ